MVSSAVVLAACSSDDTVVTETPDAGDSGGHDHVVPSDDGGGLPDVVEDTSPPFDAGVTVTSWVGTLADSLCNLVTRCCWGQTNVPDGGALDGGGTFDRNHCVRVETELGFEGSNIDDNAIAKGNVTLDQAMAKDCLDKIDALPCTLTGAQLKAARAACFGALKGTLANGQPCRSSIECSPGSFCLPDADAGADAGAPDAAADAAPPQPGDVVIGKCAPLRGPGGNCGIVNTGDTYNDQVNDSIRSEEACSYRGGGDTNLRCDSYDFDAGVYPDRAQWKCAAQVANGEGCNDTVWCADGICSPDDNYVCKSPLVYFTAASCSSFKNP